MATNVTKMACVSSEQPSWFTVGAVYDSEPRGEDKCICGDNFVSDLNKEDWYEMSQWPEPKDGEPRLHIKEAGNSPVIPDGWVMVPVDPTDAMVEAMYNHPISMRGALKSAIAAAPQQE